MKKKTFFQAIGITLFLLGSIISVYIGAISVWGDIEASFFNSQLRANEKLPHLKCPAVLMENEVGKISARFDNTTEKPLELDVRAYMTDGFVTIMREYLTELQLEPGETKDVTWEITADQAAYDRLILARVHQMKEYPLPYRNAACGVVVINLPFSNGLLFVIALLVLSVLLCTGGILLWAKHSKPIVWGRLKIFKAMIVLSSAGLALAIAGLIGLWGLGVILIAVWVLLAAGMLFQFSTTPKKKPI